MKVICYLRPQIDVATSSYTTGLKNGSDAEFDRFIDVNCSPRNTYYHYLGLVERWTNVFGKPNLTLRIFDTKVLVQGDIVRDFLKSINLNEFNGFDFPEKRNRALNLLGQEILRINNSYNYKFIFR